MSVRFNPPPNWPQAPAGWMPPDGWAPNPAWGPLPDGWNLWIDDDGPRVDAESIHAGAPVEHDTARPKPDRSIPLFRARAKAREFGTEADRLNTEIEQLRSQMARLGILDAVQLERHRADLAQELEELRDRRDRELTELKEKLARLEGLVVRTEDTAVLQEAGVYEYRHPLDSAIEYQSELERLKDSIKEMNRKDGGAVRATTNWTVNGSAAQGRTMVRDFSKLMLRAYNAEADNLVRSMKPFKLDSAIERLTKVTTTIEKLGRTMDIEIGDPYHRLRIRELELTADHHAKVSEEKEREREERVRLREEKKAQQELERERTRLDKERQHHQNALDALIAKGDEAGAARLRSQLAEIDKGIQDVEYRAANVRAGYVYVISNAGAFGDRMIKIGMTRRLEPQDRIRELSDASVPFNFDVHALFFSQDAVGIEMQMHQRLANRRVNRVNMRREFFYATPSEAKVHLLALTGDLLHFDENAEAAEYHQSRQLNVDD